MSSSISDNAIRKIDFVKILEIMLVIILLDLKNR